MPDSAPIPIAIVGMGCRYPGGASGPEALWSLLAEGRDAWSEVPQDRFNWKSFYHPDPGASGATIQKGGHFIDQSLAAFDAGFFGIAPTEAETLDPVQRVVLEASWEAVENAGIPMKKFRGSDTAVFVAMFGHDFEHSVTKDPLALTQYHITGCSRTLVANRVSYVFDLHGPSVMLDTACSGSLVALNSACQSLRAGETEMALAGGAGLIFSPDQLAMMSAVPGFLNGEGQCFAFDERGDGFGRGEGVGMLVLKRLDDAIRDGDDIRAVIRSTGANQDGRTNGITLPSQSAQENLARKLFRGLDFKPDEVQYAEAHGTGTKAGDMTEMQAIKNVFCEDRDLNRPLFIGTAKPNIGHTEAASGSAGVIKTVLAMEKGLIPPNILLENLKSSLDPDGWNLKIAQALEPWPSTKTTRKAVVNSFGYGGTNAMVVLESSRANLCLNGHIESPESQPRLFTFSARSEYSLRNGVDDLRKYLESHDLNLDELSHTLAARRSAFEWRTCVVAHDTESLVKALNQPALAKAPTRTGNVLVFTGQGAQWARMGYELISTKTAFSQSIRRSDQMLQSLGAEWNLVEELSRDDTSSRLNDSKFGQPASTAVQVALVDLLKSWNVPIVAVIGHSSGEIAAAYAAEAITHSAAICASYHRSFLSDAAKRHIAEPGAMMAVGIGEQEVQEYISKLTSERVVVACVNSPSSTTVSGDAPAVLELKKALDAGGVFNRLLKVDTAYHSHHMERVSQQYLDRLEGLESGSVNPSIRLFSTVTGEEKTDDFGAAYWVANLVSKVRFSEALQRLCQEMGHVPLNLVEVGPHKALGGPVRQSLAKIQAAYTYIPTLVRPQDGRQSLLETAHNLFKAGGDVDIGLAASLGILSPSPRPVRDLPVYHWNHSIDRWNESRLSQEYRFKRHAHHDLLGSRLTTSPDNRPSWRTILSLSNLPWLKDHVMDDLVVFPPAAYMTMAIEAIKQMNQDHRPNQIAAGYHLKNVSFKKTLALPKTLGVEVIINFRSLSPGDAYEFSISSISDQEKWQEHCDGSIYASFKSGPDNVEQGREADLRHKAQIDHLSAASDACTNIVNQEDIYAQMAAVGNQYGPSFAIIEEARMAALQSVSKVTIPNASAYMPAQFIQPHVIHPISLEAVIQAPVTLFQQHCRRGSKMPILIADTFVSAEITNQPGEPIQVVCDLNNVFADSAGFNTVVYQNDSTGKPLPVLTMSKGEVRKIGTSQPSAEKVENIYKLQSGIDARSIRPETLESVVIPQQSDEVGMSQAQKVDALNTACAIYIQNCVNEVRKRQLIIKDDYRSNLFNWMTSFISSDDGKALIQRGFGTQDPSQLVQNLGVEGEAVSRFGPSLASIVTGETDPLSLFVEENLIYRIYHGDECARPNRYLADYVKMVTNQRSDLRILEIGAGTGGTTLQLLRSCSPDGEGFCAEYMYTDISSGFFENVRTTTLKEWQHMITFKTLDLEKDPKKQGFEEYGYDLVIAANVVHATRSLAGSLGGIRRLLKPGGRLGLVEHIKTTPFVNMIYGSISGWWAGVDEGRTASPLQSTEQWHQHMLKASFSGVDLAAYDLPDPQRHSALLISTARLSTTNGYHEPQVHLWDTIPKGGPQKSICAEVQQNLAKRGYQTISHESSTDIVKSATYIILDSVGRLFLEHAAADQFAHMISLLSKSVNVYWITCADGKDSIVPYNALIADFTRTARNENDKLNLFTLDVQDTLDERSFDTIANFIASTEAELARDEAVEFDVTYRNSSMHIQRLVPDSKLTRAILSNMEDYEREEAVFNSRRLRVEVQTPGDLASLGFVADEDRELAPDEVEVQAYAWGVNFKDIFVALGQTKSTDTMVGESAGVVTRVGSKLSSQHKVGDRVVVMMGTPFASQTRAKGHTIRRIPDSLSFTDAASIPVAFGTAYYGLVDCANLQQGQTVLIHAASGGLGQAAIMVAKQIGATIFATASSREKRQILVDKYLIPESHIFSSRTTDFADGVRRLTDGLGVDAVVNSLSGDALQASWECLADLGTFVEMGKTDISRRNQLSMEPFDRGVRFVSVDMAVLAQRRPKAIQDILKRVFAHFESKDFLPLPVTIFPIADIEKAFRLVQARKHTGKVVLEANSTSAVRAKVQPLRLKTDATYVLVGGLGELEKRLCRYLQFKGARHIMIISNKQLDDNEKTSIEKSMIESPASIIRIIACDVAVLGAVRQAVVNCKDLPPVQGVIHSEMLLSDKAVFGVDQAGFRAALESRYYGTKYLVDTFAASDLDFFIMLSSGFDLVGSLSQANYARVSEGMRNFVTIDAPLNKGTYPISHVSVESLLPVVDYAMSGRASKDGCNQITFGIDPQIFLEGQTPPLFRKAAAIAKGETLSRGLGENIMRTAEDSVAHATTRPEAERLILQAIQEKVFSLIVVDSQDLSVDVSVTDLALDSLVAIEIRNWIINSLQAPIKTNEILDSSSLRALSALVSQRSSLIKQPAQDGVPSEIKVLRTDDTELPKVPLPSLEASVESMLETVAHRVTEEELQRTRKAIAEFLSPDSSARRCQAAIERRANDPTVHSWVEDITSDILWLKQRDQSHPRLHNFFHTHPFGTSTHSQAERATLLSLTAYKHKLSIDDGSVERDIFNDQPQCMSSIRWLYNSNRTPALSCDRVDRWPGNDYLVAMRRGHLFKIPIRGHDGVTITHERLKAIFQAILLQDLPEINWVSVFTTDNRDEWAKTRDELITSSPSNEEYISTLEKSLFAIYLEDQAPLTTSERAACFLFDDNSNRWLDKTISFIVCSNGVSATFTEHAMADGATMNGIAKAIRAAVQHTERESSEVASDGFTYMPFSIPSSLVGQVNNLRSRHVASVTGYALRSLTHASYGPPYLRSHKLPSKSIFQLIIQVAIRRQLGRNPPSWDVVNHHHFDHGRIDVHNVQKAEVTAFCDAVDDPATSNEDRKRLLIDAAKAHARAVSLVARGRGWFMHLLTLEVTAAQLGEERPALFSDPVYDKLREHCVFTSFIEVDAPEMGNCYSSREAFWVAASVTEEGARFTIVNGSGHADEFVEHLKGAANTIKEIIES